MGLMIKIRRSRLLLKHRGNQKDRSISKSKKRLEKSIPKNKDSQKFKPNKTDTKKEGMKIQTKMKTNGKAANLITNKPK